MNTVELNTVSQKVGATLKAYREKSGLPQGAVAKEAGISTSMLSQMERGLASPSIDSLARVCATLGIAVSELFARIEERRTVEISRSGHRLTLERDGATYEQLAHFNAATGSAELFKLTVAAGSAIGFHGGQPQHAQEGVEMGYVLQGKATLVVDGEPFELTAGDGLTFPASLPHSLQNSGKKEFVALWTAMPSQRDYLGIE